MRWNTLRRGSLRGARLRMMHMGRTRTVSWTDCACVMVLMWSSSAALLVKTGGYSHSKRARRGDKIPRHRSGDAQRRHTHVSAARFMGPAGRRVPGS